jgi:hypothetical protein
VALLLLLIQTSAIVFRATVLSIVLLFAAGPSASLFCKAWCDPREAAASGCHHEDSGNSTSFTGDDSCPDSIQRNAILTKENLRSPSTQRVEHGLAIAQFPLALTATGLHAAGNQGRATFDLKRPLTTPLRI